MKVGNREDENYRPLSAAVKERLVRTTSGRRKIQSSVISLSEYDDDKIIGD